VRSATALIKLTLMGVMAISSGCQSDDDPLMLQVTNESNVFSGPFNQILVSAPAASVNNPTLDIAIAETQGRAFQAGSPDRPLVLVGSHLYSNDGTTVALDPDDASKIHVHMPEADIRTGLVTIGVFDSSSIGGSVDVHFKATSFAFTNPSLSPITSYPNPSPTLVGVVAFADLDGDQQPDQILVNLPNIYVILSSLGTQMLSLTSDAIPLVVMVQVMDLDGDGNLDLVVAKGRRGFPDTTPDYIDIYLGPIVSKPTDGNVFTSRKRLFDFSTVGLSIGFAEFIDMNNDNKPDIVVRAINSMGDGFDTYELKNVSY
jgi:hypothetical protein